MGAGSLLACGQFDGEGAAQRVHLVRPGFAGHRGGGGGGCGRSARRRSAAVLAVDEELSDLLRHRDVVHHHGQLGRVHRALVCEAE